MRRSDREVKDFDEIVKIIKKCDVCRIALNGDGYPYILPLNFGSDIKGKTIELYFHGANEGTKLDLIAKDNRAAFEMDCSHRLVADNEKGYCSMEYESVIGTGRIEILPKEEKIKALSILMKQYHKEDFDYSKAEIPNTTVFKLTVESVTGKHRFEER